MAKKNRQSGGVAEVDSSYENSSGEESSSSSSSFSSSSSSSSNDLKCAYKEIKVDNYLLFLFFVFSLIYIYVSYYRKKYSFGRIRNLKILIP